MISKCMTCGLPKDESHSPWCMKCTFMPNRNDTVSPPEPTKLTRDQAIRAKALECAMIGQNSAFSDQFFINRAAKFEDYIQDGRKGDE